MLTADNVSSIFAACLADDKGYESTPEDYVIVEGITASFALKRAAISERAAEITQMLNQLPDDFHEGKGGGMSFLNMCIDRDGNQWTGMHLRMQELVVLGLATNEVQFPLPKMFWAALPGGMPYIVVKTV